MPSWQSASADASESTPCPPRPGPPRPTTIATTNPYTEGDAEIEIPSFVGRFDWVFVRGISHLHRSRLDTDEARAMVRTLLSYTKPGGRMLHSYHTTQDGTGPKGSHFNHTLGDLAKLMETAGTIVDASRRPVRAAGGRAPGRGLSPGARSRIRAGCGFPMSPGPPRPYTGSPRGERGGRDVAGCQGT